MYEKPLNQEVELKPEEKLFEDIKKSVITHGLHSGYERGDDETRLSENKEALIGLLDLYSLLQKNMHSPDLPALMQGELLHQIEKRTSYGQGLCKDLVDENKHAYEGTGNKLKSARESLSELIKITGTKPMPESERVVQYT